jgi:hypothetical protein
MEKLFRAALDANAYQDIRVSYNKDELIAICNRVRPSRLAAAKSYLDTNGIEVDWSRTSSGRILDYVYEIDAIIAPAGLSSPKRFGFHIITDTQSTRKKLRRTVDMWDLWSAISVTHFAMVVITTTEENVANCYRNDFRSDETLEQVRDSIDKVIFALDDMSGGSLEVPFTLII